MTKVAGYEALVAPRSVALIGVSGNENKLTARPLKYLRHHGFKGSVFPINPGKKDIAGYPCFADIRDLPEVPEHAYVLLDSEPALKAVEACGKAGVRCVSVLADGFAEAGPSGQVRQERLVEIARRHDMLLIGPNSTGVVNARSGFVCTTNAAFVADRLPEGRFSVLSQSGSIIGAMLSRAAAVGLGFGTYVSLGNEALADVGTIGRMMINDPEVDGVVLFLETLRNRPAFVAFAEEAHRAGKPVLAYLVGRSDAGKALAASHTGAMMGGGQAIETFLKAHGILTVDAFETLAELANALRLRPRLTGRPSHATVVTTTGGGGGMVYDGIGLRGVSLAPMSPASHQKIRAQGTDLKEGPLVDVTLAGTKYDVMKTVISTLLKDPECGLVIAAIGSSAQFSPELAVKPIVDAVAESGPGAAPVLAVPIPHAPESLALFNANGVPACRTVEGAAEVIAALFADIAFQPADAAEPSAEVMSLLSKHPEGALTEVTAAKAFSGLGVTVPATLMIGEDGELPSELPFKGPYALKVVSRDLLHKSDVGGVRIGLADRTELTAALAEMRTKVVALAPSAAIEGYLIQRMETGLAEAIVGVYRDPVAGPIVTVGAGGVMTEIYHDVVSRPAPVTLDTAHSMLDEVSAFALLRGYRGASRGDLDALAQVVTQVSRLAACDRVVEAEINPVLVRHEGAGAIALDALIRLCGSSETTT